MKPITKRLLIYTAIATAIFICVLGMAIMRFSSLCNWNLGEWPKGEQNHYKRYDQLQKKWKEAHFIRYIPENSIDIQHYYFLVFDTNYHYMEATVNLTNLEGFVKSHDYFGYSFHHFSVPYSDTSFKKIFPHKPDWWNQESLAENKENCLIIGPDHINYGKGLWLFYNKEEQKIRVFVWSQQWLSLERVKKELIQD